MDSQQSLVGILQQLQKDISLSNSERSKRYPRRENLLTLRAEIIALVKAGERAREALHKATPETTPIQRLALTNTRTVLDSIAEALNTPENDVNEKLFSSLKEQMNGGLTLTEIIAEVEGSWEN